MFTIIVYPLSTLTLSGLVRHFSLLRLFFVELYSYIRSHLRSVVFAMSVCVMCRRHWISAVFFM